MRQFAYITLGKVLEEIKTLIKTTDVPFMNRSTYYKLEKRLNLPRGHRKSGKVEWRVYSTLDLKKIKAAIRKDYNLH